MSEMDGLVSILCSVCGRTICMTVYGGFSTAKCVECQSGNSVVEESKPLEVLRDEGKIIEENPPANLFEAIIDVLIEGSDKATKKVREIRKKISDQKKKKINLGKDM